MELERDRPESSRLRDGRVSSAARQDFLAGLGLGQAAPAAFDPRRPHEGGAPRRRGRPVGSVATDPERKPPTVKLHDGSFNSDGAKRWIANQDCKLVQDSNNKQRAVLICKSHVTHDGGPCDSRVQK